MYGNGQNYPPYGDASGYPPQNYPPHGYPPQGYPAQDQSASGTPGYPPQGQPGYPPQGTQGYPGQVAAHAGYPAYGSATGYHPDQSGQTAGIPSYGFAGDVTGGQQPMGSQQLMGSGPPGIGFTGAGDGAMPPVGPGYAGSGPSYPGSGYPAPGPGYPSSGLGYQEQNPIPPQAPYAAGGAPFQPPFGQAAMLPQPPTNYAPLSCGPGVNFVPPPNPDYQVPAVADCSIPVFGFRPELFVDVTEDPQEYEVFKMNNDLMSSKDRSSRRIYVRRSEWPSGPSSSIYSSSCGFSDPFDWKPFYGGGSISFGDTSFSLGDGGGGGRSINISRGGRNVPVTIISGGGGGGGSSGGSRYDFSGGSRITDPYKRKSPEPYKPYRPKSPEPAAPGRYKVDINIRDPYTPKPSRPDISPSVPSSKGSRFIGGGGAGGHKAPSKRILIKGGTFIDYPSVKYKDQDYDQIKSRCLRTRKLFEDDEFPATHSSISNSFHQSRSLQWKRPGVSNN